MFLDNKELRIYGAHQLTLDCLDSSGTRKLVSPQVFWSADFQGYDLVLGYLWLAEAGLCIRFSSGTFEWFRNNPERIQIASVEELFSDIGLGEQLYLLYLRTLRDAPTTPDLGRGHPAPLSAMQWESTP
jgi:hypothetical protein